MIIVIWLGIATLCLFSYWRGRIDGTMSCINHLEEQMAAKFGPNWKEKEDL